MEWKREMVWRLFYTTIRPHVTGILTIPPVLIDPLPHFPPTSSARFAGS